MDFSTEFVALRDRIVQEQDKAFVCKQNIEVAGRVAALVSTFDSIAQRKLLGVVPTGGSSHAHEYRLLFAVPTLDETALEDWWEYALQVEQALVQPDMGHDFSLVSVILVTGSVSRPVQKKLRKLASERQYKGAQAGWSSVRIAVVGLEGRDIHTNRMGDSLKNILKPIV